MPLAQGARLGPYQILGALGAGGMGEVYRALDPRLGREVAVKVLPADRLTDPARRARFVLEARAASALNHPHIVTIHEIESASRQAQQMTPSLAGLQTGARSPSCAPRPEA